MIPFMPLETDPDSELVDWKNILTVASCLQQDLATQLVNKKGEVDEAAIKDCVSFLDEALKKRRDRNVTCWGTILYFMLILNVIGNGTPERVEQIFEWVVKQSALAIREMARHSGVLEQFVISAHKVNEIKLNKLDAADRMLFHHNYRTNCSPHAAVFAGNGPKWFSYRVESVCAVIMNTLNVSLDADEVRKAVNEHVNRGGTDYQLATCQFWDQGQQWPIANAVRNDETNTTTLMPIPEEELDDSQLKKCRFALYVLKGEVEKLILSATDTSDIPDYKQIWILNSAVDGSNYNLFEEAMSGDWNCYRVKENGTFAYFCSDFHTAFETTQEVETFSMKQTGFSVLENYEPAKLVTWFCETAAPKCLPHCLFHNPFIMIAANGIFTNDPDYPTQNELWVGDVVTPKAVRDDPSMRPQSPVRLFDDGTPSLAERTDSEEEAEPSEEDGPPSDDDGDEDGGGTPIQSESEVDEELDLLWRAAEPGLPADLRSNSASWSDHGEDDELAAQGFGAPSKKRGSAGSVLGDRTSKVDSPGAPRRLKRRKAVSCLPPMMRHDE